MFFERWNIATSNTSLNWDEKKSKPFVRPFHVFFYPPPREIFIQKLRFSAQDAFVRIGRSLQKRRKNDLYETVTFFSGGTEKDPAGEDASLKAKLEENRKHHNRINDLINKWVLPFVFRPSECFRFSFWYFPNPLVFLGIMRDSHMTRVIGKLLISYDKIWSYLSRQLVDSLVSSDAWIFLSLFL